MLHLGAQELAQHCRDFLVFAVSEWLLTRHLS
jgi:hypothetical protein